MLFKVAVLGGGKVGVAPLTPLRCLVKWYILYYCMDMDEKIIFKPSAFKHDVSEADIRNAFDHALFDGTVAGEEHKHLLVGLDQNGNPLEILYNVLDENAVNIFHAMKCRKAWRNLKNP